VEKVIEKWTGKVNTVTIGATAEEGGTRSHAVTVGGETTLPFLFEEGEIPHWPAIAVEVWDVTPPEWPAALKEFYQDVYHDPVLWAQKVEKEIKPDLLCLRFVGAHPDNQDKSAQECTEIASAVKGTVKLPLIIWGSGNAEKDNRLIPQVSQALAGERVLLGSATQDNYKVIAATAIADGHSVVSENPLDINICKQVNILLTDMDVPLDRIVIYPTTGALGYGFEYAYSLMERARLAALGGDKMMAMPMLAVIGAEAWKAKEAKAPFPQWGPEVQRGIAWEAASAAGFLQGGADILIMHHPRAVEVTRRYIDAMMQK
jgi:acetyl-CoA decarbonylase/synthase complex subunit delta